MGAATAKAAMETIVAMMENFILAFGDLFS